MSVVKVARNAAVKMTWQSGLMRVTRNHVPSGAQVRILVSSVLKDDLD